MKAALLAIGGGLAVVTAGFAAPAIADARYGQPTGQNGVAAQLHVTGSNQDRTRTQAREHQQLTTQDRTKIQDQTRDRQQLHQCWS